MSLVLAQNEDSVSMILSHLPVEIIRFIKTLVFDSKTRQECFSCIICKIAEFFMDYTMVMAHDYGLCCSDRCSFIYIKKCTRYNNRMRYPHTPELIKENPYFHLRYPNGRHSFEYIFDREEVDRYDEFLLDNDLLECASKLFE